MHAGSDCNLPVGHAAGCAAHVPICRFHSCTPTWDHIRSLPCWSASYHPHWPGTSRAGNMCLSCKICCLSMESLHSRTRTASVERGRSQRAMVRACTHLGTHPGRPRLTVSPVLPDRLHEGAPSVRAKLGGASIPVEIRVAAATRAR